MAKKSDKISFPKLKKDIKSGNLQKLYLFTGEETYLRDLYIDKIFDMFDGAGFDEYNKIDVKYASDMLATLPDVLEGFPMMTDRRVVCIRGSGVFKKANNKEIDNKEVYDDIKKYFTNFFANLSDDTVLIFSENETDPNTSLYKLVQKYGEVVQFNFMEDNDAVGEIIRDAKALGYTITDKNARYMIELCTTNLEVIHNELNKLTNFCGNDKKEFEKGDIDKVVSKSLQFAVFDLCDYMTTHNADEAIRILQQLKYTKESPYKILIILLGTFDKIFHIKLLVTLKAKTQEISSKMHLPRGIVSKYINLASKFTFEELFDLILRVSEYDLAIKSGKIGEQDALEQYIFDFFSK